MDLEFRNNQTWVWNVNILAWASIYPLTQCTFHMQIRTAPGVNQTIYAWSSNPDDRWGDGTILYDVNTGLLTLYAPMSEMKNLPPGKYQWDLLLRWGSVYKVLAGGAITIDQGVTTS